MEEQIASLREKVLKLTQENANLLSLVGGTTPTTSPPAPTIEVQGIKMKATQLEIGILAGVAGFVLLLWAIPFLKPCRRCCESRLYKIFPLITIFNFVTIAVTLNCLHFVKFNDLFFMTLQAVEVIVNSTQQILIAFSALLVLILLWKFKDRILETLGVDNPSMVVGEFRDWATLWSMKRFYPIEVFIWKVEGLPGVHLHQMNDLFVEVSSGYNNLMRTRVHLRGGHCCVFKESMQMNFDHMDKDTRFNISVKNQDVVGSSDIASIQLGAQQVYRNIQPPLSATQRTLGWGTTSGATDNGVWNRDRFVPIDLIPAGQIYLRFQEVQDEEKISGPSYGKVGETC